MKKKLFVLLFCIMSCNILAQSTDSIIVKEEIVGFEFYQNNKKINSYSKLVRATKSNTEANKYIIKAKRWNHVNSTLALAGGVVIGWQLGNVLIGEKVRWQGIALGAGFIACTYPIHLKIERNITTGTFLFNQHLASQSRRSTLDLSMQIRANSIGLLMRIQ